MARPRHVTGGLSGLPTWPVSGRRRMGVEINMVLYLPRDTASVPVTRQVLDGCLKTLGVTPDTRADIALALSEACANVIQHAGPGEEYEVRVSTGDCRCAIEVVNTGSQDGEPLSPDANGAGDIPDSWRSGAARADRLPSLMSRSPRWPRAAVACRSSTRWSTTCS